MTFIYFIVILKNTNWCWKASNISTVVVKERQRPLRFVHTGYLMSYEVSHETTIVRKYCAEHLMSITQQHLFLPPFVIWIFSVQIKGIAFKYS